MDEKRSKRISKGKHQRRKKQSYSSHSLERMGGKQVTLSAVPPAEFAPIRLLNRLRSTPSNTPSPDQSLQNVFPDPFHSSKLTLAVQPVKFKDAIANVDASFDFGQTQLSLPRPSNIEVPHFTPDFMLVYENFTEGEGRQDSQANDNSFLMDSILKVNRSHRSINNSHMDQSNSHLNSSRFIRMTSGRRSPAPIMILDDLAENNGHAQWGTNHHDFHGIAESLNASNILFQTLPAQGDMSYDTIPFADRFKTDGMFLKIGESVLQTPKLSMNGPEKKDS